MTDLTLKASLRLTAVSRASLRCRIQCGWHPVLPTVVLNKHWGKAAVLQGLLLLSSHETAGKLALSVAGCLRELGDILRPLQ